MARLTHELRLAREQKARAEAELKYSGDKLGELRVELSRSRAEALALETGRLQPAKDHILEQQDYSSDRGDLLPLLASLKTSLGAEQEDSALLLRDLASFLQVFLKMI